MRFFLDQCVPHSVEYFLEQKNHEVLLLRDYLPTNAEDGQVIQKAQSLNTVLVSLNGDFADLITYPPSDYKGIIGLQVKNRPEAIHHILRRLNDYFQSYPHQEYYEGKLILVEPHRIRIRQ